jgi:hypothetical protein
MKPHRIKIAYKTFDKFQSEYNQHLSKGWQFVKTPRPLAEGSGAELVLTIPGRDDPIVINGKVVREPPEGGDRYDGTVGFFLVFSDFLKARVELDRLLLIAKTPDAAPGPPASETAGDTDQSPKDDSKKEDDRTEDGDDREAELLSTRIRGLSVKDKMILAPKANKNERAILIRDGNSSVMRMIIRNPRLGDSEIARIARDISTPADVLDQIGKNRKWIQNQEVRLAVVKNPRTPTSLAIRQLPFLPPKDISALAKSQHVKDTIKREALKLVIQRHERN